jgi:predicted permease
MRRWNRVRSWLRATLRRSRMESEMDAELRFHMEARAEDLMRAGLAREEAMRRAKVEFGGAEAIKEECREAHGLRFLDNLAQDARYALRTLRKSPGFAAVAVLTLALGIGANSAIFSVVDGILLKPLPYRHAGQLVGVELSPLALDPTLRGIAPEDYFILREQSRTFQDVGIYLETDTDHDVNVTGFAEPERVHALHVTDGVLSVLGVPPMLGRIFTRADDSPGAPPTVILTFSYWQRKFGDDRTAVGRTLVADGVAREIIGVLPRDFRFLDQQDLALIVPVQLDRNRTRLGDFRYFGIGRLRQGSTIAQASADFDRLLPITLSTFPPGPGLSVEFLRKARLAASILPLKQEVVGNIGALLWVLMGGVGMVLLIACANVANLLLVRTAGRQHELELRAALGAGQRRIAAQLLCESAVLGLLGGVFGLGVTWAALRVLVRLAPTGLPRIADISMDVPELLFTLGTALFTSLLFGMIPIFKRAGENAGPPSGGRTLTASREHQRAQNSLVTVQVALALVLLVCSGLMIRTFRVLTHVNPGFIPAGVQTFRVSIPAFDVPDDASVPRIEEAIQDKLAAISGVSSVAFSSSVPMDGNNAALDNVFAADHAYEQGSLPPLRRILFVSPRYLQTLGIPLVAGREFNWTEMYNQTRVALISENLAREYWQTPTAALGHRIRPSGSGEWREIIGVVGNVHDEAVDKPARAVVYWPAVMANYNGKALHVDRYATFAVRSPLAGSEDFLKQVRRAVWSVDAKLPLAHVNTLNYFYMQSMARTSFTLVMLGIAAGMALLLSTVGLYGVIAYSVSRRTREIGIRMALGAQRRDVMATVVGGGVSITGMGLALGLGSALLLTRFLSSLLFGVRSADPLTYAVVVFLLGIVALAACYIPARRATRVDPMIALRYE